MKVYLAGGIMANLKSDWIHLIEHPEEDTPLKLYLVGVDPAKKDPKQMLQKQGTYVLESFFYADEWTEKLIPRLGSFMLDSGAFTFFSSNQDTNWDEYVERYCDFINRNHIDLFFELDIDKLIGYDKVKRLRTRIEQATGKQPIPVWHKSRGIDEFYRMCDEYPYVAIGGIVSREIKPKEYRAFPHMIREAHKRGAKIHGLGFTNLRGMEIYHFDSVDSTSWTTGNRFGSIYRFDGRTMQKVDKAPGQRLKDSRKVALNNFSEWVKFQRYALNHL